MTDDPWMTAVEQALEGSALFVRGGFHPKPADNVPALADGAPCRTLVLIGNAGNDLWHAFQRAEPDLTERHPLDGWVGEHLRRAADAVGTELVNPMVPPYPPIQQWAVRARAGFRSPINLLVHPEYGLWHTFRGALLFREVLPLPDPGDAASPCDTCERRPCLTTCPVGAFVPEDGSAHARFSPDACVNHVDSAAGRACQMTGCLARRACPIGRPWAYEREPAAYHMAAVVRTVRRWQSKSGGGRRPGRQPDGRCDCH